jgi:RNA polymerase sigma-70 factor (ECF subfamily)
MQRDEILARLRERIVVFAASQLSRDIAEDVAQEVLLLLHTKYREVALLEDLLPLSLQIARFKIVSLRRKAHRRGEDTQLQVEDVPVAAVGLDPAASLEKREMLERLTAALAKLEGRCRELFRLKLQGKGFAEIQQILGVKSINTVYTWDFRCRKQLLERLGGVWEAER